MTTATEQAKGMLALLGGWELTAPDGRAIVFPAQEKGRALLAFLAAERRWHYREQLGELLWPDSAAPRANLRQALSVLRTVLGDDARANPCLQVQRNMVRFAPDAAFMPDVAAFMGLASDCAVHGLSRQFNDCIDCQERAVARYRGEFMAGFSLPDCPEFEAWLQVKREAFRRHAQSLLARLADWHEANGAPAAALAHAQRYVELDPWDEPGQRRLMRLYAATGNSGAIRKQYDAYCRQLHAELGTAPGEETRALYERLCQGGAEEKPSAPAPARALPERRQVTVLYCEMSAPDADPEEVAALLQAPTQDAIDIIRASGGHHIRSHGAGLLAYFGYPRVMEDAAVLAARAALAIRRGMRAPLAARIGLHTGLIVTGTDSTVPDAAGQASSQAIRLCQAAEPGEVRASGATHALVHGYVRCAALDGTGPPSGAVRVLGETSAVSRLQAAARLAPLVGRVPEVVRLAALWREAASGGGTRAVLLRGDPGIGKSRLLRHFRELADLQPRPDTVRELCCRPEYQNTALHPLSGYLAHACDFAFGDSAAARRDKLQRQLAASHPELDRDAFSLLTRLLAIADDDRDEAPASPQQERQRLIALLLHIVARPRGQQHEQPLLLIVEDLHWADPSTLELLDRLLDEGNAAPLLVLLTARPEFRPGWRDKAEQIDLPPLSAQEAAALVGLVDTRSSVPAATVTRIVAATDGVPLFIEETTRMLMTEETARAIDAAAIPATLRDLLAARLDRCAEARQLAQVCAAIGREFCRDLLDAVTPLAPADTARALRKLEEAGLVSRIGAAGATVYQFRHALIQEAAYQSQTRAARREAHRRIAHALRVQAGEGGQVPEVLARHFFEAGDACEAVQWWRRAGAQAAGHGNVAEAIEHFQRARAAMPGLPQDAVRDELELSILVELGSALISSKGYGAAEADRVYSKALALSEKCGASLELFRSIWGLYLGCSSRTTHSEAMRLAERLLQLARQDGDPALLVAAHYACANSSYSLARFVQTCEHMEQARRLYEPGLDERLLALFGEHPYVSTLLFGAWALWARGEDERALEAAGQALAIARSLNHPQTLGFACCLVGILHRLRGEPARVGEYAGELAELAGKHGFAFWHVTGGCLQGWVQAAGGDANGPTHIAAGIAAMRAGMFVGALMYFMEMLVEAYRMLSRHEEQLRAIDEALQVMHDIHDRHFEAELYRLKGECLLALGGDAGAARQWLERARDAARAQGAAALEARAAASLAALRES